MIRMLGAFLALALASIAVAISVRAADGDPLVLRLVDVSALLREVEDAPVEPHGLRIPRGAYGPQGWDEDAASAIEADDLVAMIRARVEPDRWAEEGTDLRVLPGGRLIVRHRAEVVERTAALVRDLERALLRPIQLEVRVRRPGSPDVTGSAVAFRGQRVAVSRLLRTTILEGYDVEVAQASRMADPIVAPLRTGTEVHLRPRPLSDGRRVGLEVVLRSARLRDRGTVRTEATALGTIDLPVVETTTVATTTIVPAGSFETVASVGFGKGEETLEVRIRPPPPGPSHLLDAGFLLGPRVICRPPRDVDLELEAEDRDRWIHPFRATVRPSRTTRPGLLAALAVFDVQDDVDVLASHMVLLPRGADVPAARRALAGLETDLGRVVTVALRLQSVAAGEAGNGEDANGGRDLAVVRFDTRAGRWAAARTGTVRNVLTDYVTEIAKDGAEIPVPDLSQVLDGVTVEVRPRPVSASSSRGEVEVRLRLDRVDPESLGRMRRSGTRHIGVMQLPRVERTRFEGTIPVRNGESVRRDLGLDPAAEGRRLALVVTARW